MNPRQPSAGISGLPSKPPGMAGPAPPLPSGPPPPQPPYQQQNDAQAAHAAAWAAYYQSQGQTGAAAAYAAPASAAGTSGAAGAAPNPYANYGYSAAASAQHSAHAHTPYPAQPGPSQYRPPVQQYQATPQQYNAQPAAAYGQGYQQPYGQQYPQQPQGAYSWGGAAPTQGQPNQPYRPPQQHPSHPQQPYYPQQQQNQSFSPIRPSPSPGPTIGPNRPYQPGNNRIPSGPRPPMGTPPPSSFPPAKRPRFDGPGGGGPPPGPAMQHPRPPVPVRPSGINMGQPGFNPRPPAPNHPSLPSAPIAPTGPAMPSGPSGAGTPSAPRGNTSSVPPITRPPIHLGLNGPPPPLPFGGSMRSGLPGGRGMRGGARGGMINAPRGPAGMRRQDPPKQARDLDRKRKDKERDRAREKEEKITMTDFRIVGIEVKGLDWAWGLIGGEVEEVKDEVKEEKAEEAESTETKVETQDGDEAALKSEDQGVEEAGQEPKEEGVNGGEPKTEDGEDVDALKSEAAETLEEKRGEKRKAKTPEIDEASSPKKRSGEYLLTHGKPNETSSASTSVHESNQNRFRIYFESPAELDRVPKALRRNPNKRWRRASSSMAPSVVGDRKGREGTVATVDEAVEEKEDEESDAKKDEKGNEVEEEIKAEKQDAIEGAVAAAEEVEEIVGGVIGEAEVEVKPEGQDVAAETAPVVEGEENVTTETVQEPPQADTDPSHEAPIEPIPGSADCASLDPIDPVEEIARAAQADDDDNAFQAGDVSMRTDQGDVAAAIADLVDNAATSTEETPVKPPTAPPAEPETNGHAESASEVEAQEGETTEAAPPATADAESVLVQSAENTASAYKSRTRRRSSVSSAGSADEAMPETDITTPSTNRVSILYEGSSRRLCIDADAVAKVRIHREEGKIEVILNALDRGVESKELPKGVLVEMYDSADQRFVSATSEKLDEIWADSTPQTVPPFQRQPSDEPLIVTVYLNKKRPLSEPKWCRTNSADEWLIEQFGAKKAGTEGGWKGKLQIVDPDPAPTLQSILDSWASSSSVGSPSDRRRFTDTLQSDPNDLLEILLRLTRGERNPAAGSSGSGSLGPLATAIRSDSPFASHQTHVSLAILAMYRLTTDYAAKAGEKSEVVNEKISDIIKSLPVGMIHRSLDGLFREWDSK